MIDYLANPSIRKKNEWVINAFIRIYIPKLEENPEFFKETIFLMKKLQEKVYSLKNEDRPLKALNDIESFFNIQSSLIE